LITKNNGLLSLRQWGQTYQSHNVESWQIMDIPNKDTSEGKQFYTSSVNITYQPNQNIGNELEYLDESKELDLIELYRQSFRRTFVTNLLNINDVQNLGDLMLNRFGFISETLTIKLGYNTIDVNMLDNVNLEVKINDRTFSRFTEWIVREVNPAQDVLVLESV
jgi:hypothetical protein